MNAIPPEVYMEIKRFIADGATGKITLNFSEGILGSCDTTRHTRVKKGVAHQETDSVA